MRTFSFGVFIILFCGACDPYLTKSINHLSEVKKGDSIYVMCPIIETRMQTTKDSYHSDGESFQPAFDLTKKAIHILFSNHLPVKFEEVKDYNFGIRDEKVLLDSLLNEFTKGLYASCSINKNSHFPTKANLILIPYLIWTRTIPEFQSEKGNCGKAGYKDYFNHNTCTWTRSQAFLFLIDRRSNQILYYKENTWMRDFPDLPFEDRVTKSFKQCAQPLLRRLR
jgi:hypothetical protein